MNGGSNRCKQNFGWKGSQGVRPTLHERISGRKLAMTEVIYGILQFLDVGLNIGAVPSNRA